MFRRSFAALVAAFLIPAAVAAQDPDQELLNQLYREIVTSSAGQTVSDDTFVGKPATVPELQNGPHSTLVIDPATERLQHEIDKMVDDVKMRHLDAVRFMQETR